MHEAKLSLHLTVVVAPSFVGRDTWQDLEYDLGLTEGPIKITAISFLFGVGVGVTRLS